MNFENHIENWAKIVESHSPSKNTIPCDSDTIVKSFKGDISDKKYAPTEEFLVKSYEIMNRRFFSNKLPKQGDIDFHVHTRSRHRYVGLASYKYSKRMTTVVPKAITLNSSRIMTLHEWLEVVIHEMIHILDCMENPDRFFGGVKYDVHGQWFMDEGRKYDKYGFHVQQYCKAIYEINTDDPSIKRKINNVCFLALDGYATKSGIPAIIMISMKDINKYKSIFEKGVKIGRFKGLKRLMIFSSDNPSISRLRQLKMKDHHSKMPFYNFSEDFSNKFGPFKFEDTYELFSSSNISEDKDETEFDDMNRIDDEFARKMYDNIEGVVDVQKNDDETYIVSIA